MPVRSMFIDVDLTLIDDNCELFPGVEAKLKQWKAKYDLHCWSHGGKEHAKRVCKKHKIDRYFTAFLDKPDIIVDDNPNLITEFPAILRVKDPQTFWKSSDDELFKGSRTGIVERTA